MSLQHVPKLAQLEGECRQDAMHACAVFRKKKLGLNELLIRLPLIALISLATSSKDQAFTHQLSTELVCLLLSQTDEGLSGRIARMLSFCVLPSKKN